MKIKEVASVFGGATPSTVNSDYYDGDIIWFTPKDLSDQGTKYISKGARTITKDGLDSCSASMLPKDTVLLSTRAPIGLVAISTVECCTNQGFKSIVCNQQKLLPEYLYYYLKYHIKEIESLGSGTTFKEVSKASIEGYEIEVPDFRTQKTVISVLGNIDSKISTNNTIISELEAMAKDIYDYWFVQFDFPDENGKPYKSSGGKMVWNEELKREIPEGWKCGPLQNICNIHRGASPRPIDSYMDVSKKGIPWVKISDATCDSSPFLIQTKEYIKPEGVKKSVIVYPGTLIVSNSATPGIPKFMDIDACVHDGWLVIDGYRSSYRYYLYYLMQNIRNSLLNIASGSVFKNLKTDYLKEYLCFVPSEEILIKFDNEIALIMNLLLNMLRETKELASLRDFLLPLLMNGQVKVGPTEA